VKVQAAVCRCVLARVCAASARLVSRCRLLVSRVIKGSQAYSAVMSGVVICVRLGVCCVLWRSVGRSHPQAGPPVVCVSASAFSTQREPAQHV
jgi:hypothetical protein